MIDHLSTSLAWQTHPGDIAVLPIGSTEQHGYHMPLATDCLQAEYWGRFIATELKAALLPVLPYGNCFEHSGFRGSFTLRPETLMQVVRDLVDELERQHFRIVILLNGHGGNYALGPVVRDINRVDREIKVIAVNWWEHGRADVAAAPADANYAEVHSGQWETALMLALFPETVAGRTPDLVPEPAGAIRLEQRDLNTFGVGHFNPHGPVGAPSRATAEDGQKIVTAIRASLLPWLRDRIERLRQNPRYCGAGGVVLRQLYAADIPEAMRLKNIAGWNQLDADWRLFLELCPQGCYAAVHNGGLVGTATALAYADRVAWIGMVLVDPVIRRGGIGRQLMNAAIEGARRQCKAVKLDATPDGKKLYDKLGFKDEYLLHRLIARACVPGALPPTAAAATPTSAADLPDIVALDTPWFGADRNVVLRALLANAPGSAFCLRRGGRLVGYCLGRRGMNFHQVGPVMAENEAEALILLAAALAPLSGQAVVVDVAESQAGVIKTLQAAGFSSQRTFMRMYLGENAFPGVPARCYAIAGPELG